MEEVNEALFKQDWNGKKIVVAEDEDFNYMLIEEIFDETKVELLWAKNGEEAVRMCKEEEGLNLVLMDIKMPKKNGLEATREIRKKNKTIPIIAQTAYAMSTDEKECIEAGCTDYISKPIDPADLVRIVMRYI